MTKSIVRGVALAAALGVTGVLTLPSAHANVIGPNQTVNPDLFGAVTGTVLATATGTWSFGTAAGDTTTGTYLTEVIRIAGGTLDFVTQVVNNGVGILKITDGGGPLAYAGFTVDVGTATSAPNFVAGNQAPTNITKNS